MLDYLLAGKRSWRRVVYLLLHRHPLPVYRLRLNLLLLWGLVLDVFDNSLLLLWCLALDVFDDSLLHRLLLGNRQVTRLLGCSSHRPSFHRPM